MSPENVDMDWAFDSEAHRPAGSIGCPAESRAVLPLSIGNEAGPTSRYLEPKLAVMDMAGREWEARLRCCRQLP